MFPYEFYWWWRVVVFLYSSPYWNSPLAFSWGVWHERIIFPSIRVCCITHIWVCASSCPVQADVSCLVSNARFGFGAPSHVPVYLQLYATWYGIIVDIVNFFRQVTFDWQQRVDLIEANKTIFSIRWWCERYYHSVLLNMRYQFARFRKQWRLFGYQFITGRQRTQRLMTRGLYLSYASTRGARMARYYNTLSCLLVISQCFFWESVSFWKLFCLYVMCSINKILCLHRWLLFKHGDCLGFDVHFLYTQLCLRYLYKVYCSRFLNAAMLQPVVISRSASSIKGVGMLISGQRTTGLLRTGFWINSFLVNCAFQHSVQYMFSGALLFNNTRVIKDNLFLTLGCIGPMRRRYAFRVSESSVIRLYHRSSAYYSAAAYRVLCSKLLLSRFATLHRRRIQLQNFLRRYCYRCRRSWYEVLKIRNIARRVAQEFGLRAAKQQLVSRARTCVVYSHTAELKTLLSFQAHVKKIRDYLRARESGRFAGSTAFFRVLVRAAAALVKYSRKAAIGGFAIDWPQRSCFSISGGIVIYRPKLFLIGRRSVHKNSVGSRTVKRSEGEDITFRAVLAHAQTRIYKTTKRVYFSLTHPRHYLSFGLLSLIEVDWFSNLVYFLYPRSLLLLDSIFYYLSPLRAGAQLNWKYI